MRDNRFKAVHRGGPLDLQCHHLLAIWAADCAEHVLFIFSEKNPSDDRPRKAIETARAWTRGECTVGQARSASVAAHAAAREINDNSARAAARSAGHAVATAHMADHSLGAAWYALKAVKAATDKKEAVEKEHAWQLKQLPEEIYDLVISGAEKKSI